MALEVLKDLAYIGDERIAHLSKKTTEEEYMKLVKTSFIVHNEPNNAILFKIQDGPVKEVGRNGCQVLSLVHAALEIVSRLDERCPSPYNKEFLFHLAKAIESGGKRTAERESRGVEGKNLV